MTRFCTAFTLSALLALSTWSASADAQTMTLRIADNFPVGHIFHQVLTKPFIAAVEKASSGQIKLQHFPGEQLGKAKDMLVLTQTGVVDIGTHSCPKQVVTLGHSKV